jgi:hypothetical protein
MFSIIRYNTFFVQFYLNHRGRNVQIKSERMKEKKDKKLVLYCLQLKLGWTLIGCDSVIQNIKQKTDSELALTIFFQIE